MTRILTVTAHYPRDADTVFAEAISWDEMADATRGVATYQDLPQGPMLQGETYMLNVTVWRVMRNPNYQVHVERLDEAARVIQSREAGWMIRSWDHTLSVEPEGAGCRWTDRIEIDCAWATGYMAWVGKKLYLQRHRNRHGQDITASVTRA